MRVLSYKAISKLWLLSNGLIVIGLTVIGVVYTSAMSRLSVSVDCYLTWSLREFLLWKNRLTADLKDCWFWLVLSVSTLDKSETVILSLNGFSTCCGLLMSVGFRPCTTLRIDLKLVVWNLGLAILGAGFANSCPRSTCGSSKLSCYTWMFILGFSFLVIYLLNVLPLLA